jgi:hypothetical protein
MYIVHFCFSLQRHIYFRYTRNICRDDGIIARWFFMCIGKFAEYSNIY